MYVWGRLIFPPTICNNEFCNYDITVRAMDRTIYIKDQIQCKHLPPPQKKKLGLYI